MGKKGKPDSHRLKWSRPYKLPEPLEKDVVCTIEECRELGYTGVPEFVRDAVREKLGRMKTPKQEIPAQ